MLRFGTLCLAPGEAPPGPAILESQRVHFAGAGGAVGLGWHISAHDAGAGTVVWHNGRTGGYGAFVGVDKKAGNVVVILVNDVADVDRAGFGLLEFLRR
jgi:CubicO group peptidase (beta-lactamase class C family)